ncbi:unnamed protein product [Rangifer tarandus platyrhynchus]|uniref:Uncharacterized protein n=1 Tax=Rangifer tarandus platyrhynchus TaxID=3082113 RepID=A0ABN8YIZ3_RANTA|nr:unnamed protein product [Rangifer tarandus platyrhynchus]
MPPFQEVVSETVLIVSLPDKNQAPNQTLSGILMIRPSICVSAKHGMCVHTMWYTTHPQRVEVITTLSRACMHHSSHCPHLAPLWYITESPSQAPFLIHPLSPTSSES